MKAQRRRHCLSSVVVAPPVAAVRRLAAGNYGAASMLTCNLKLLNSAPLHLIHPLIYPLSSFEPEALPRVGSAGAWNGRLLAGALGCEVPSRQCRYAAYHITCRGSSEQRLKRHSPHRRGAVIWPTEMREALLTASEVAGGCAVCSC